MSNQWSVIGGQWPVASLSIASIEQCRVARTTDHWPLIKQKQATCVSDLLENILSLSWLRVFLFELPLYEKFSKLRNYFPGDLLYDLFRKLLNCTLRDRVNHLRR